nr:retrotransposon protein [Tanacetum cinerariifolium]
IWERIRIGDVHELMDNEGNHNFCQLNTGEQIRLQAMMTGQPYQGFRGPLKEATWEWMPESQSAYSSYHLEGKVIFKGAWNVATWAADDGRRNDDVLRSKVAEEEKGYWSRQWKKFLRAVHPKWKAKVMTIEESKDLASLSLDEVIRNLKVHKMIIKKDSEIVKAKGERKSLALKAKKESSDEECLTFRSEDEEYAMANDKSDRKCFRCGDPNHLIGECPDPPRDKNQRAFARGSWSDSGKEDDEKVKDETCLVAQASNEDGKVIGRGIRKKGLYVMKLGNKPKDQICLATIDKNSTLWNRRLGHVNMHLIQSISYKKLVRNLPKLKFDQHFCDACKIRRQAHANHKAKNIVSMTRFLELLHMDLFGPSAIRSYEGNHYTLVIVDDYCRKIEESLNVTFDETPPSKTSPLVDDDLDEKETIKITKKKNLENDIEDETLEIDEIINIKESRDHPLENVKNGQPQYHYGGIHQTLRGESSKSAIVLDNTLASDAALSCGPTVSPLNDNEIDFRISFDESYDEDYTVVYDENSFSYKIISVKNLKTDSENDNDKVNMPSFPSPEPEQSFPLFLSSSSSLNPYTMDSTQASSSKPSKKIKLTIIQPRQLFVNISSDEDVTTTPSPIKTSSSPSPPNAPSKTPSTKDTSSTFGTTSFLFETKPQSSPPTSNVTPSRCNTSIFDIAAEAKFGLLLHVSTVIIIKNDTKETF